MIAVAFPMALFVKEIPDGKVEDKKNDEPKIPLDAVVKDKAFYLLAIGSMCSIGAVSGISQNLKLFFSLDLHYTQGYACQYYFNGIGSKYYRPLVDGVVGRPYHKKYVMMLIYTLISVSILLLYYASTRVLFMFSLLYSVLAWVEII
jgi:hypothetical protein